MSVMDIVRKWSEKKKEKSLKYKELEEDYKLHKMLEDRQKSSNKRELEDYYKRKEEEAIKRELDAIHKQEAKNHWKTDISMINSQKRILKNDRPILKEKNIFKDNKRIFSKEHSKKYSMGVLK